MLAAPTERSCRFTGCVKVPLEVCSRHVKRWYLIVRYTWTQQIISFFFFFRSWQNQTYNITQCTTFGRTYRWTVAMALHGEKRSSQCTCGEEMVNGFMFSFAYADTPIGLMHGRALNSLRNDSNCSLRVTIVFQQWNMCFLIFTQRRLWPRGHSDYFEWHLCHDVNPWVDRLKSTHKIPMQFSTADPSFNRFIFLITLIVRWCNGARIRRKQHSAHDPSTEMCSAHIVCLVWHHTNV